MNIETARAVPLREILEKMGAKPVRKTRQADWYYSPLGDEGTAGLKVNKRQNTWHDFAEGRGGDGVDLVCKYLQATGAGHTISDALRWLGNMFEGNIPAQLFPGRPIQREESALVLKSVRPLAHIALVKYLEDRGISKAIATGYLKEVSVLNRKSGKEFLAVAMKNEDGGYDYRNLYRKGCVRKKAISFIRGAVYGHGGIHVFEDFMDFLSVIMQRRGRPLDDDAIVLNSASSMQEVMAYIRNYGYRKAFTWLDNDEAGEKATLAFGEFFACENILHKPMNGRYAPHKDVNEAHKHSLKL